MKTYLVILLCIFIVFPGYVSAKGLKIDYSYGSGATKFSDDNVFVSNLRTISSSKIGIDEEEPMEINIKLGKCFNESRGCYSSFSYGGKSVATITIDRTTDSDDNLIKVFVHELGHARFALLDDNKQQTFFSISHDKNNQWKPYANKSTSSYEGFASGYGASAYSTPGVGKYEDFAEAFTLYVFHNNRFKEEAKNNIQMRKKYIFMKTSLFYGEFLSGKDFTKNPKTFPKTRWDVTTIPVDMDSFLKFLTYSVK